MRVEIDSTLHTLTLDSVVISLDVLDALINPNPKKFYRFKRTGDVISIEAFELEGLPSHQ